MNTVLVICPTEEDRHNLSQPQITSKYRFIFEGPDVWKPHEFNAIEFIEGVLDRARKKTLSFDAVIGTDDYPACIVASIIAKELGLPGPRPEAVLLCQHKYHCRVAQAARLPKITPEFALIDFTKNYKAKEIPLTFPFFLKPVKSYLSMLAKRVNDENELEEISKLARTKIPPFARPFNELIRKGGGHFNGIDGNFMIAEELLGGQQVSLEGYLYDGNMTALAIFDSLMHPGTLSFKRFETPSKLPKKVQKKMCKIAERAVKAVGLDNTCFNIEFFYNRKTGSAHIIEINPRMACQFVDLIEKVHGWNLYEIQLELALGKRPEQKKKGKQVIAASFPLRVFEDRMVTRIPTKRELVEIYKKFPEAAIHVLVTEGDRISIYPQDSDSYRYCIVNMTAENRVELYRKFEECRKELRFEFSD